MPTSAYLSQETIGLLEQEKYIPEIKAISLLSWVFQPGAS